MQEKSTTFESPKLPETPEKFDLQKFLTENKIDTNNPEIKARVQNFEKSLQNTKNLTNSQILDFMAFHGLGSIYTKIGSRTKITSQITEKNSKISTENISRNTEINTSPKTETHKNIETNIPDFAKNFEAKIQNFPKINQKEIRKILTENNMKITDQNYDAIFFKIPSKKLDTISIEEKNIKIGDIVSVQKIANFLFIKDKNGKIYSVGKSDNIEEFSHKFSTKNRKDIRVAFGYANIYDKKEFDEGFFIRERYGRQEIITLPHQLKSNDVWQVINNDTIHEFSKEGKYLGKIRYQEHTPEEKANKDAEREKHNQEEQERYSWVYSRALERKYNIPDPSISSTKNQATPNIYINEPKSTKNTQFGDIQIINSSHGTTYRQERNGNIIESTMPKGANGKITINGRTFEQ